MPCSTRSRGTGTVRASSRPLRFIASRAHCARTASVDRTGPVSCVLGWALNFCSQPARARLTLCHVRLAQEVQVPSERRPVLRVPGYAFFYGVEPAVVRLHPVSALAVSQSTQRKKESARHPPSKTEYDRHVGQFDYAPDDPPRLPPCHLWRHPGGHLWPQPGARAVVSSCSGSIEESIE